MKLRPALPHLSARFHGPLRFGRFWRGHELPLRIVQLVFLIVFAGLAARLVSEGVALATRLVAGLLS